MSIESEIAAYMRGLYRAVGATLKTDVLDAAREKIVEQLNDYDWTQSRGEAVGSGGLRDRQQIVGEVWRDGDTFTMQVVDEAEFQKQPRSAGDELADVVTEGDEAYHMPYPRPFMDPAERAIDLDDALGNGLRKRGY